LARRWRHDGSCGPGRFNFEGNDVDVQPSLEAAARSVEAVDVDNGEYEFFGDDGTLLQANTVDDV
jgi:hypothetical protein